MATAAMDQAVSCPKCGGDMWDNRVSKRNPKAPDFKCKNRSCDGVVWPPKGQRQPTPPASARQQAAPQGYDIGRTGIAELDEHATFEDPEEDREVARIRQGEQDASSPAAARLAQLFKLQEVCFTHALKLAAQAEQQGVHPSLEGVSALTAQAMIAFNGGR